MQPILIVVIVGIIGGILVTVQASLAGMISDRLGLIENAFVVFGGGFVFALILLIIYGGGNIKDWRSLPRYVFLAGPMGVGIISTIGFAIPRIGVASTLTLIIAAQLIIGVILDHFGWLTVPRPMDISRIVGMVILLIGAWIILR
jgi:transporter family-2 protein